MSDFDPNMAASIAAENTFQASQERPAAPGHYLAAELREALDDPRRGEWGGYPWEHLGDAERDVRALLAYIESLEVNRREEAPHA